MNEQYRGLWRGKRLDNSEWAVGKNIMYETFRGDVCISNFGESWHTVDPDTLGECTGMCDKNDTPIFEGDIVEVKGVMEKRIAPIVFIKGKFVFDWKYSTIRPSIGMYESQQIKVIGNIHDNPELLAEGAAES